MRGFDKDFFRGHFGPHFGGPPSCPFRGEFHGHHGKRPGFGPFGGFDHSPERHGDNQHGPEHHRRGPEGGFRGCGHHGASDNECDGARGHLGPRGGPSCRGPGPCFGRRPDREGHQEHGPEQKQRGRKDGHCGRGCDHHDSDSDSDGPADRHCRGLPGFRKRGGRHHGFHGYGSCHGPRPCFGQCRPFDFPHGPFRGPWEGPWGSGHPRFGRHGPHHQWFSHRRPCPYNNEERSPRKSNCEKCRDNEPCCTGNKENRGRGKGRKENGPCCDKGRKENGPCFDKDKDQNLSDTVFVQRIVLEKATRPQSV